MAIRGFGDRFVKPPVDLQDSSRVRHLHKLNLTLEGETGALVSDKGLLLLRLPLELGFQQVATPRLLRICRAGSLILCHTIFRRASQVLSR